MSKRGRLDLTGISNKEAYARRLADLKAINLSKDNVEVVVMTKDGKSLVYKLSEIPKHIENVMKGKKDPIGLRELYFAKELIAFERCNGS